MPLTLASWNINARKIIRLILNNAASCWRSTQQILLPGSSSYKPHSMKLLALLSCVLIHQAVSIVMCLLWSRWAFHVCCCRTAGLESQFVTKDTCWLAKNIQGAVWNLTGNPEWITIQSSLSKRLCCFISFALTANSPQTKGICMQSANWFLNKLFPYDEFSLKELSLKLGRL